MTAFRPPDAWFSFRTISLLVTLRVETLLVVVVPETLRFPVTLRSVKVTVVVVLAPLAVTLARVSVSV